MSNYSQTTFFAPKDALLSGNPAKLIKGADFDPEFAAIAAAIATKLDSSNSANPTASVGLSAVNGSAGTYMRSDGAPALNVGIVPTWTGIHTFSAKPVFSAGFTSNAASTITAASGIAEIISGVSGGDIARWTDGTVTASFQTSGVNGYIGTTSNHTFNLVANNATAISIATSGLVAIGAGAASGSQGLSINPSLGVTPLQLTNNSSGSAIAFIGGFGTSTGAATPTLSANKPGSSSGTSGWLQISVGGLVRYIPVWS